MLERINLILKTRNLNAAQFADEIGVQRSSVSHILTGRNKASLDFLLKVLARYPEIDTDWLLTGKGVMMHVATEAEFNRTDTIKVIQSPIFQKTEDKYHHNIDIHDNKDKDYEKINEKTAEITKQTESILFKTEEQKKPDESVFKTTSARQIEKIVIFYSDKTFGVYNSES